jgi:hypothetical protein
MLSSVESYGTAARVWIGDYWRKLTPEEDEIENGGPYFKKNWSPMNACVGRGTSETHAFRSAHRRSSMDRDCV